MAKQIHFMSPQRARILYGLWAGESLKQIAINEHMSEGGLAYHLMIMRLLLGAKNNAHLLAIAKERGYFE